MSSSEGEKKSCDHKNQMVDFSMEQSLLWRINLPCVRLIGGDDCLSGHKHTTVVRRMTGHSVPFLQAAVCDVPQSYTSENSQFLFTFRVVLNWLLS